MIKNPLDTLRTVRGNWFIARALAAGMRGFVEAGMPPTPVDVDLDPGTAVSATPAPAEVDDTPAIDPQEFFDPNWNRTSPIYVMEQAPAPDLAFDPTNRTITVVIDR